MNSRRSVMSVTAVFLFTCAGSAQDASQRSFASPEEAAQALVAACAVNDKARLVAILGPSVREILSSGDETADQTNRKQFAAAYEEFHKLAAEGESRRILSVGREEWPLPIPIVKRGNVWQFETLEGTGELLRRRIASNEAAAIRVCRLYVELQREYASKFHDDNTLPGVYAQKLMSDPGKHNGLYWKDSPGGERSPASTLVELAEQEGYSGPGRRPKPFHGYFFRVLTAQGEAAPGGAMSYFAEGDSGLLADRKMTRGFALVAYPAKHQMSGVMTFIVNQDGIVYQKDLGEETAEVGRQMREYNPDGSWAYAP